MAQRDGPKAVERAGRTAPRIHEARARSDPFQILEAEHELLRAQIRRTAEAAPGRRPGPGTSVEGLIEVARRHMEREDTALYPVCERLFGPFGAVSVMRTDHAAIEAELLALRAVPNGQLVGRLARLAERIEAHLAREERVLFPMMAALLSGTEMDRLARQLRAGPEPHGDGRR